MEMMFWDDKNRMKKKFFRQALSHLKLGGDVYFGWADFGDLDSKFPEQEANKVGLTLVKKYSRRRDEGSFTFFVYKFKRI